MELFDNKENIDPQTGLPSTSTILKTSSSSQTRKSKQKNLKPPSKREPLKDITNEVLKKQLSFRAPKLFMHVPSKKSSIKTSDLFR